jgi:hypothetical protein
LRLLRQLKVHFAAALIFNLSDSNHRMHAILKNPKDLAQSRIAGGRKLREG